MWSSMESMNECEQYVIQWKIQETQRPRCLMSNAWAALWLFLETGKEWRWVPLRKHYEVITSQSLGFQPNTQGQRNLQLSNIYWHGSLMLKWHSIWKDEGLKISMLDCQFDTGHVQVTDQQFYSCFLGVVSFDSNCT